MKTGAIGAAQVSLSILLLYNCCTSTTAASCYCESNVVDQVRRILGSTDGHSSCSDIIAARPTSPSGTYTLLYESGEQEEVFCFMGTLPRCGYGGWRRVGFLDRTQGQPCPAGFTEFNDDGIEACTFSGDGGCTPVFFSTSGQNYSSVCGRVRGYSFGGPDSFARYGSGVMYENDINGQYLDGVSITYGTPRQHLWSYVSSQTIQNSNIECPCSNDTTTVAPPAFVGDNYYCEAGGGGSNVLWDGEQCNAIENDGSCCNRPHQPWFYRAIPETNDEIELRVCRDEPMNNEHNPIDQFEAYVQ